MRATLWTFEVVHVKSTTRLEDALDRPQRPVLFVGRQVVESIRGDVFYLTVEAPESRNQSTMTFKLESRPD